MVNFPADVKLFYAELTVIACFVSVSPSQPDADPKRDGEVTLRCSLLRYIELNLCQQNTVRWVDETGAVLLGEGGQTDCVSVLTAKRQSGNNRRYTCQLVDKENNIKIEADDTSVLGGIRDDQPEKSNSGKIICSPPDALPLGFSKIFLQ